MDRGLTEVKRPRRDEDCSNFQKPAIWELFPTRGEIPKNLSREKRRGKVGSGGGVKRQQERFAKGKGVHLSERKTEQKPKSLLFMSCQKSKSNSG